MCGRVWFAALSVCVGEAVTFLWARLCSSLTVSALFVDVWLVLFAFFGRLGRGGSGSGPSLAGLFVVLAPGIRCTVRFAFTAGARLGCRSSLYQRIPLRGVSGDMCGRVWAAALSVCVGDAVTFLSFWYGFVHG